MDAGLEARLDSLVERLATIEERHASLRDDGATLSGPWVLLPFFESVLRRERPDRARAATARSLREAGFCGLPADRVDWPPAQRQRIGARWTPFGAVAAPVLDAEALEWMFGGSVRPLAAIRRDVGAHGELTAPELELRSLPDRRTALLLLPAGDGSLELDVWPRHPRLPRFDPNGLLAWCGDAVAVDRWRTLVAASIEALDLAPRRLTLASDRCIVLAGDTVFRPVPGRGAPAALLEVALCFGEAIPYAPRRSDSILGRYALDPCGLGGAPEQLHYDVYRCRTESDRAGTRLSLRREPSEREAAYFARYPDVAGSRFAGLPAGARLHYELYGRAEGREF